MPLEKICHELRADFRLVGNKKVPCIWNEPELGARDPGGYGLSVRRRYEPILGSVSDQSRNGDPGQATERTPQQDACKLIQGALARAGAPALNAYIFQNTLLRRGMRIK